MIMSGVRFIYLYFVIDSRRSQTLDLLRIIYVDGWKVVSFNSGLPSN